MKNKRTIDNNPFCPICGPREENRLTKHTNIKVCNNCVNTLLRSISEPTQIIENEKVN